MRRITKVLIVISLALLAAPIAGYFAYDLVWFYPHRGEISHLVESAEPGDRLLPATTTKLLLFSLHDDTTVYTTRLLLWRLNAVPQRPSYWLVNFLLWQSLVDLHLTDHDRLTLIASLSPTGSNRRGLSATSRSMYGKPLSQLSVDETATLIVLAQAPSREKYPEELVAARSRFLERYRDSLKEQQH